jgi:hypothetical protein
LFSLFFDPEDEGEMFLRNGILLTDYTALYPSTPQELHHFYCSRDSSLGMFWEDRCSACTMNEISERLENIKGW